ncbi:Sec1 family domain-containing protein MIP3 [Chlorella vulgaris]
MAGVQEAVLRSLQHHSTELAGSLLYLDDGAAEAVASGVGLTAFSDLGVAATCDLAAATAADLSTAVLLGGAPVRRVTFFITTLLADAEAAVLAACALHTAAAQFTVLCAASQAAHHDELPAWYRTSCYSATCTAWQQQLNDARRAAGQGPCSLSLLYCPLLLCPLSSTAFVLPPSAAAAVLPRVGAVPAGFSPRPATAAADDSDDDAPTHKEPLPGRRGGGGGGGGNGSGKTSQAAAGPTTGVALLAHSLSGVAALLGFRAEAFAVGPFSRLVCREMAFVPAMAEDAPAAALVLVDRVLDPVSPSQHADLLIQRLYSQLQQQQQQQQQQQAGSSTTSSSTAGVPFPPPFCTHLPMPSLDGPAIVDPPAGGSTGTEAGTSGSPRDPQSMVPGCLRHPGDAQAERWLEFLLSRRGRDGPLFVRKWLREAVRKENVPQAQLQRFKPGSISAAELHSLADCLRRQSPAAAHRHAALLQLAEAAAAALEGRHADSWEAMQREERALLFACAESPDAAAAHLTELCQLVSRPGGAALVQLADLVSLVLLAYCVLPDFRPSWYGLKDDPSAAIAFQPRHEAQLQEGLVEAVMASGSSRSSSGGDGGQEAAAVPLPPATTGPLEALCRRVAAAKKLAVPMPGGGPEAGSIGRGWGSVDEVEAHGGAGSAASSQSSGGALPLPSPADAPREELPALQAEVQAAVAALLARMRQLAALRHSQLKQLKQLAELSGDGTPQHTPLLRQIVEHVLDDKALPDLHAGATSLSGLLRSGLASRFGLQAGPKPSDCSTIIVFVVGGISMAELHHITQAVDERAAQQSSTAGRGAGPKGGSSAPNKPPPRIIVGATALLQPGDMASHLFADLP